MPASPLRRKWKFVNAAMGLRVTLMACAIGLTAIVALQAAMRDDGQMTRQLALSFGVQRALVDAQELRADLLEFQNAPASGARERAQMRVQVLKSRLQGIGGDAYRDLIGASESALRHRAAALRRLGNVEERLPAIEPGAPTARVEDATREIAADLEILGAEALRFGERLEAKSVDRRKRLGFAQIGAIFATLGAIAVALGFTMAQNRRLAQAHRLARLHSERFEKRAKHDALTGLPNRGYGHELAASMFARARDQRRKVGALCLDVDRFKQINDTLGHGAGDALLKTVADHLAAIVAGDFDSFAARQGGDEFWICRILSPGDDMADFSNWVAQQICRAHELDGHRVTLAISGGYAIADPDDLNADNLLGRADMALRQAKERGRARVAPYVSGMAETRLRRLELEGALQGAVARGELSVVYQPIVSARGAAVEGVEAFLRWSHPKFGDVAPEEFIAVAEDTGLTAEIGSWSLREACRDIAGFAGLRVAVNISPVQLVRCDMTAEVRAALIDADLPADRLTVEITEATLLRDPDRARMFISDMREIGVGVSLDDFGAGFSSLTNLSRFRLNRLKLDHDFLADVDVCETKRALVRAALQIAAALKMPVTAEGVERHGQALVLSAEGCDSLQGHLFARPMPADRLRHWLASRRDDLAEAV